MFCDKGRGETQRIRSVCRMLTSYVALPFRSVMYKRVTALPLSYSTVPLLASFCKNPARLHPQICTATGLHASLGIPESTMPSPSRKGSESLDSLDGGPSTPLWLESPSTAYPGPETNTGIDTSARVFDPSLENATIDPGVLVWPYGGTTAQSTYGTNLWPIQLGATHFGDRHGISRSTRDT